MYTDYWGFKKHPFDNVPDPEMYFDMDQSVDDAVSEVLFAIEEGDECLAVVVGEVGVGKTMCLRIVLDSLDHEKYRIAFVTNPDMTFPQLLREMIGQLEGKQCEETRKDRLFEIFNKILFDTSDKGKRVVIFIDEGNVIKPHNLDSLRLLTNMQDDKQNLFTIVLAGQPELGKRLEDPRRANLFQRIGVYCKIHGLDSLEMTRDYIEHRLERAGLSGRKIFTNEAYKIIWDNSEDGTPRIINKICKLALKAAETNQLKEITGEVVKGIAGRFMRTYRKQRRKPPTSGMAEAIESNEEENDKLLPPVQDLPVKEEKNQQTSPPLTSKPEQKPIVKAAPKPRNEKPVLEKEPEQKTQVAIPQPPAVPETKPALKPEPEQKTEEVAPKPEKKKLSTKEIEALASKLATEKVEAMRNVTDPFEAWEKARGEYLAQLLKANGGK